MVGRWVVGPHPEGDDQCLLHGVLGRREVHSTPDEDADDRRDELLDPEVVHSVMAGASGSRRTLTWR